MGEERFEEPTGERGTDVEKAHGDALMERFFRERVDLFSLIRPKIERRLLRGAVDTAVKKQENPVLQWAVHMFPVHGEYATNTAIRSITDTLHGRAESSPITKALAELSFEQLCVLGNVDTTQMMQGIEDACSDEMGVAYQAIDTDYYGQSFMAAMYPGLEGLLQTAEEAGEEALLASPDFSPYINDIIAGSKDFFDKISSMLDVYKGDKTVNHDLRNFALKAMGDMADLEGMFMPGFEADTSRAFEMIRHWQRSAAALCYVLDDVLPRSIEDHQGVVKKMMKTIRDLGGVPVEDYTANVGRRIASLSANPLPFRQGPIVAALEGLQESGAVEGRVTKLMEIKWEAPDTHFIKTPPAPVVNAIFNAVRNAAREKVGATRVTVVCEDDAEHQELVLRVLDDGSGIPLDIMKEVEAPTTPDGKPPKVASVPQFTLPEVSGSDSTGVGTANMPERMHDIRVTWSVVSNGQSYTNRPEYARLEELQKLGKKGTAIEWRVPYAPLPVQAEISSEI